MGNQCSVSVLKLFMGVISLIFIYICGSLVFSDFHLYPTMSLGTHLTDTLQNIHGRNAFDSTRDKRSTDVLALFNQTFTTVPKIFLPEVNPRAAVRKERLPGVIMIGSKKSGTGLLTMFLDQHPSLRACQREAHYFSEDTHYHQGLDWYLEHLCASTEPQIVIEKTPRYFVTESVPSRIHAFNASVKLILILRDPVKRLISDYDHERHFNYVYQPHRLERNHSLEELVFSSNGSINKAYPPVLASMYDIHLTRWLSIFPRDQLLVLDGEQFAKNPLPVLKKCEMFLGVRHLLTMDLFVFDERLGYYCLKSDGCHEGKGRKHKTYSSEFIERMETFYKPVMERTFNILGQRFDNWPTVKIST